MCITATTVALSHKLHYVLNCIEYLSLLHQRIEMQAHSKVVHICACNN